MQWPKTRLILSPICVLPSFRDLHLLLVSICTEMQNMQHSISFFNEAEATSMCDKTKVCAESGSFFKKIRNNDAQW